MINTNAFYKLISTSLFLYYTLTVIIFCVFLGWISQCRKSLSALDRINLSPWMFINAALLNNIANNLSTSKHNNSCIDLLSVFSSSESLCAGNLSVHWTEYPSLHTRQSSVRNITSWRQQARPGARSCPNFLDSHKMKSWGKILPLGNTSGNSPSPHRASFSNFPLILE